MGNGHRVSALLLALHACPVRASTPAADVGDLPHAESAYAHFIAPGFDPAAQLWHDAAGRNFLGHHVGGTRAQPERGLAGAASHVRGAVDTRFSFGLVVPKGPFTLCSMTRYGNSEHKGTILVGTDEHWFHGHHRGVLPRLGLRHHRILGRRRRVPIAGSDRGRGRRAV